MRRWQKSSRQGLSALRTNDIVNVAENYSGFLSPVNFVENYDTAVATLTPVPDGVSNARAVHWAS
jgi:hypothetical protein